MQSDIWKLFYLIVFFLIFCIWLHFQHKRDVVIFFSEINVIWHILMQWATGYVQQIRVDSLLNGSIYYAHALSLLGGKSNVLWITYPMVRKKVPLFRITLGVMRWSKAFFIQLVAGAGCLKGHLLFEILSQQYDRLCYIYRVFMPHP